MKYTAGLDLAQSSDYTALIVCRRSRGLMRSSKFEVVFARRWRGTPYPTLVEEISGLLSRQPFLDDVRLNVDATGIGAPILDLFERAKADGLIGCQIVPIIFSAANEPNPRKNTVPKKDLITNLEVLLSQQRLDFARDLALGPTIREELRNFGYKLSASGRATFEAAGSGHDDLVAALALATYEPARLIVFSSNDPNPIGEGEPDPWQKLTSRALEYLTRDDQGTVRCRECSLSARLSPDVVNALKIGLFGHLQSYCLGSFEVQLES